MGEEAMPLKRRALGYDVQAIATPSQITRLVQVQFMPASRHCTRATASASGSRAASITRSSRAAPSVASGLSRPLRHDVPVTSSITRNARAASASSPMIGTPSEAV